MESFGKKKRGILTQYIHFADENNLSICKEIDLFNATLYTGAHKGKKEGWNKPLNNIFSSMRLQVTSYKKIIQQPSLAKVCRFMITLG